jgi:dTDP-4-amino-4,6-dideoxygalactose transaminase
VQALRIRQAANFGFLGRREAEIPGTNGKLSEYHAAVGLAALAAWPETRRRLLGVASAYVEILSRIPGVTLQPGFGRDWASMTCIVAFDRPLQAAVAADLAATGIETRAWWGVGPWAQPAFRDGPRTPVPVTEELAERTLGLPFAVDLQRSAVDRVGATLATALARHAARAVAS